MAGRIFYLVPNYTVPFGGVAVIHAHVEILAAHGFDAAIAMVEPDATDFYQSTAPKVFHGGALALRDGDRIVIPEVVPKYVPEDAGRAVRRIMLCQNQYYAPLGTDGRPPLSALGLDRIIVTSTAIADYFRYVHGRDDVALVPCAIDPARFAPAAQKRRMIACMPRKMPIEAALIRGALAARYPAYAGVPWVQIGGVPQAQAARVLSEAAVFLALGLRESLGLPPLEAMASGCLVVGFHGDGGREYARPENGWWAQDGADWRGCVEGVAAAIAAFDSRSPVFTQRQAAMARTVADYSPSRMEAALLAFWRDEMARG